MSQVINVRISLRIYRWTFHVFGINCFCWAQLRTWTSVWLPLPTLHLLLKAVWNIVIHGYSHTTIAHMFNERFTLVYKNGWNISIYVHTIENVHDTLQLPQKIAQFPPACSVAAHSKKSMPSGCLTRFNCKRWTYEAWKLMTQSGKKYAKRSLSNVSSSHPLMFSNHYQYAIGTRFPCGSIPCVWRGMVQRR